MNILEDFGLRLKELRSRTGLSQDMLASRSGIDRSYIGGVERGERNVSLKNIELLCNTLDVDISYFFDDERFSLHTAFLKNEYNKPLNKRFNYMVQEELNLLRWQVTGALHPDEVKQIIVNLKIACQRLESGKIRLLVDNSIMMANGQPIAFSHEVTELWEELQKWLIPHCEHVVVLCNSKFMQNQMNRLAKRSGLIKVQQNLYSEDKKWLERESGRLLSIMN